MNVKRPITPAITIGDQPTEEDLAAFRDEGYVGIVNLRHDGEPEQPLSTAEEGAKVRELGMEYLHQGIGGGPLAGPGVSRVAGFIGRLTAGDGKGLVHFPKGGRGAVLVLLRKTPAQG